MSIKHILLNMTKPGYFPVMFNKIVKRLKEPSPVKIRKKAEQWYAARAVDTYNFIKNIDSNLYEEAVAYNEYLKMHGQQVINSLPVKMGGGGNCILLYFLARYLKPQVIVETGVSMGFSSHAFLTAIQKNGTGHLYSSDFPYFRLPNPEKYIGCVVEPELKTNWTLRIEGDQKNLAFFKKQLRSPIGILHYDSDKSYSGRQEALRILDENLKDESLILFDDIGDNFHFRDFAQEGKREYVILRNPGGGYVGLSGKIVAKG